MAARAGQKPDNYPNNYKESERSQTRRSAPPGPGGPVVRRVQLGALPDRARPEGAWRGDTRAGDSRRHSGGAHGRRRLTTFSDILFTFRISRTILNRLAVSRCGRRTTLGGGAAG